MPTLLLEDIPLNQINFNFSKELRILVQPAAFVTSQYADASFPG
jgi:hypothetical protein